MADRFPSQFGSQVPSTFESSYPALLLYPGGELLMLVARNQGAALRIINTSMIECRNTANTSLQNAAFYLSALAGLFPELLPLAKDYFLECGYIVKEVTEDTAADYVIPLQGCIDYSTALAIVGQLALVMYIYSKIDDRTYTRFMQSRAAMIKNFAGVVGDLVPKKGDILLLRSTAKSIRIIMGGSVTIRAELLKIILANRDGQRPLNRICKYLAENISWTGMTPLTCVLDTLVLPNSPVLKDLRVKLEVMRLYNAYKRVAEKQYPQYYKILYPDIEARSYFSWNGFKTLTDVARRYIAEHNPNTRSVLVNDLLSIHRAHMTRIHGDGIPRALKFLTPLGLDEVAAEENDFYY